MRRSFTLLAVVAAVVLSTIAAGCGGSGGSNSDAALHSGIGEQEAREMAMRSVMGRGEYGRLTLDVLARRTSPDGTEYWEAEFVDADGVRWICTRIRGGRDGGSVTRDCGPRPEPQPGADGKPA